MRWLSWLKDRLAGRPPAIPAALWQRTMSRLPFLTYLSDDDRVRLKSLSEQLLAKKPFAGVKGFELTDEMVVPIAAQAALLVLNLSLDLYDDLSAVIVTPDAFPIRQQVTDDTGVVHEWDEMLAGEAVDMGGAVLLSWPDIAAPESCDEPVLHNIVIHEFAHKIDMGRGGANGYPPFLAGYHLRADFLDWPQVFGAAYEDFCRRVDQLESTLPEDVDPDHLPHAARYGALTASLPMDPYAATDPAEFFAVASESFFVTPAPIAAAYPEVYWLLSRYYRQDPLAGPVLV
jgi:Mlc titration factor MtfA (ptsG expression regulator)